MFNSIKIIFRNSVKKILNKYYSTKTFFPQEKTLLILRIDAIGDYILFRNFIESIKKSERFKDYKITLAGNPTWKNIAETFDKEFIDNFIWIDKARIKKKGEWLYRLSILEKIRNGRFETMIIPNDTTSKLIMDLKKHSGVRNIIEKESDSVYLHHDIKKVLEKETYEKDHRKYLEIFFQFYRNKRFAEEVIGKKINLSKPFFKISKQKPERDYVIIFPGAGYQERVWLAVNYGKVCRKISENTDLDIFVCGNKSDSKAAKIIIEESGNGKIKDLTDATSLSELINLIANAKLLISNETCAVHIAASVETKTICISNGNHIGRFNPYPEEISKNIETIYPLEITNSFNRFPELINEHHFLSTVNINSITPDEVFEKAEKHLKLKPAKKYSDVEK